MMNPAKFKVRNLTPIESWPVRCVGFERRFWGKYGMAEIRERDGAEFHAVLHRVSAVDMAVLDEMERGYIRKDIECFRYDGTRIVATGYQFDLSKIMVNEARPPSERYKKLMLDGMRHYGCDPGAIDQMEAVITQEDMARQGINWNTGAASTVD
uniref:Gamma-glutamylcyclotransferase n=1 Tax=Octactis speculum TaxID=3111310 RepID=A0A7S2AQY1_9STRA